MGSESEFLVNIKTLLEERQCVEVLHIWNDESSKVIIENVGWELVGVLCGLLNTNDDIDVASICKTMLYDMEKICQGKEILLGLNEQLMKECNKDTLSVLLELCTNVFLRLKRKQSFYLSDILDGVTFQVKSYHSKKNNKVGDADFEDMQRRVFQFVSEVLKRIQRQRFSDLESHLQEVLIAARNWNEYEIVMCRKHLLLFIYDFNPAKINALKVAEITSDYDPEDLNSKMEENLLYVANGILALKKFPEFISLDEPTAMKPIGLMIFFYLVFVKEMLLEEVSFVYNKPCFYRMVIQPITASLKSSSKSLSKMGLELHSFFMQIMDDENLLKDKNNQEQCVNIALGFTNLMIWSDDEKMRMQAKQQFDVLLQKWKPSERSEILRSLYIKSEHAGLQGYLIDTINSTLKKDFDSEESQVLKMCDIKELIDLFLTIEIGQHHILQETERLMAGLNFVRFWLLRDRNTKKTGIRDCLECIKEKLACIRCGIEVAVVEYNKFLASEPSETSEDIDFEIAIPGGDVMRGMPIEEKRKMAELALVTLDMMLNVIVRLNEIIEVK